MRIFMGSLQQETNTFSTVSCQPENFDVSSGKDMFERTPATEVFLVAGAELIPSYYAIAVPSGRMKQDDYIKMVDKMADSLRNAGHVDGVWLYLHGAMDVEGIGSGELYLLKRLREISGFDIPYSVAMDFHGNLSEEIVRYANIIRGYRTAPHRDMKETQIKAAELLLFCIKNAVLPEPAMKILPVILPGDNVLTDDEPFAQINRIMDRAEQARNVLSASVFIGQNWADTPNNHISILAMSSDYERAERFTEELKTEFQRIIPFYKGAAERLLPEDALKKALLCQERVYLSDSGDNTTAGAQGNRTDMLKLCLAIPDRKILVAGIYLPEVYRKCRAAGIGRPIFFEEVGETFTIKTIGDGLIGWDGENAGGCCLISHGKLDVILTENRCAFVAPEQLTSAGTDYRKYSIIVVKLGYLWPELAKTGGKSIIASSDGESCTDTHRLPYKNLASQTELI